MHKILDRKIIDRSFPNLKCSNIKGLFISLFTLKKVMKTCFLLSFMVVVTSCDHDDEMNPALWEELESNTDRSLTDIFILNERVGIVSGSFGTLLKTTDGGVTWESFDVGINHSFTCAFAIDESTFYTARVGLYKTENSGIDFTEVGGLSNYSNSISDIVFFNQIEGLVAKGPSILKTKDGGVSWKSVHNAGYSKRIQFTSESVGFTFGGMSYDGASSGELHKTVDGGSSWRKLEILTSEITAAHFVDDKTGYFFNFNRQLYKTTNGGESWALLSVSLNDYITDVLFIDEVIGYAVGNSGAIYKTINAGKHWVQEYKPDVGISLASLAKTPDNTIFAVGQGGVILKRKK